MYIYVHNIIKANLVKKKEKKSKLQINKRTMKKICILYGNISHFPRSNDCLIKETTVLLSWISYYI
jgi:hypothetical protein